MAFDFPNSPAQGDQVTAPNGATYEWDGNKWVSGALGGSLGTITGVVAGVGLTGGGSDGQVTLSIAAPLAPIYGGTGITGYAQGDLIYAPSPNTLAVLPKDINDGMVLRNTGPNNSPRWDYVNVDLVGGTLPAGHGGTGINGYTQGDILYAINSNTLAKLAKDTSGVKYITNLGGNGNPQWDVLDLTNAAAGVLAVGHGGIGASSLPVTSPTGWGFTHGVPVGNGANPILIPGGSNNANGTMGVWNTNPLGLGLVTAGTDGSYLSFLRMRNNLGAPSAVYDGDVLGAVYFAGYGASGPSVASRAYLRGLANENWADNAQGTRLEFGVTTNAGAAPAQTMLTIAAAGLTAYTPLTVNRSSGGFVASLLTPTDADCYLRVNNGTTGDWKIGVQGSSYMPGAFWIYNQKASRLSFRIDAGGTVVLSSASATNILWLVTPDSTTAANMVFECAGVRTFTVGTGSDGCWSVYDNNIPAWRIRLQTDGQNLVGGSGTWAAMSDERVKRNVTGYTHGLTEIRQLTPVSFSYAGAPFTEDGYESFGLVAQQVEKYLPELVGEFYYDPDSRPSLPGEPYQVKQPVTLKTLDYTRLTLALVNAVKELATELETLKGGTR